MGKCSSNPREWWWSCYLGCVLEGVLKQVLSGGCSREERAEFLELKQGDMSVTEYAAKFVELAKFYPHYTIETAEFSKCIKFENGLRAEIKRAIGYQKIRQFSDLVSSCRIYEEDTKAHSRL